MIGVQHHWSGKVKKLLKQAKLEAKEDKLLLAERMLKAKDKQQPVLFFRQVRFTQDLRADAIVNRFKVGFCFNCSFDFSRTWMVRNDDCRFFHGAAGLGERIRIMFERRCFTAYH